MTLYLSPVRESNKLAKAEIEQVQQEKQEYYLLGQYERTRGLRLFYYSYNDDEVHELEVKTGSTIHIINVNGKMTAVDLEVESTTVDSRNIHFEALNLDSAIKRVEKWKAGKIKELFNLRKPTNTTISFW